LCYGLPSRYPPRQRKPLARKILLADDSVTAQNMGRKILADAGYEVITVNNGSAALKKVAEAKPDVIILDVYMPGYSGLEVCQRLKEVHETARIPILLTVGKLEPFKPEEARRARADGYIVKPFEASELLTVLTKLEDKIVPRGEASKPGRFARAIAAVEEGRYDQSVAMDEDSGWRDRISFPSKKKSETEEPADVDDPAIYNPVNRDLRTLVERPSERAAHDARPAKPRVDLAALAPDGLPKDVTAEEIAALAAAAAQIKGTSSEKPQTEGRVAENQPKENEPVQNRSAGDQVTPAQITEPAPQPPVAAQAVAVQPETAVEDGPEAKQKQPAPEIAKEAVAAAPIAEVVAAQEAGAEKAEQVGAPAAKLSDAESEAASLAASQSGDGIAATPVPAPTPYAAGSVSGNGSGAHLPPDEHGAMAVATSMEFGGSTSRWMAVPVALLPEETAISLEQEMEKTCAALAAAETARTTPKETIRETQPAAATAVITPQAEPPVPVGFPPELAEPMSGIAGETKPAIQDAVKEFETVAAAKPEVQAPAPPEPEAAPVLTAEPATETAGGTPLAEVKEKEEERQVESIRAETEPTSRLSDALSHWREALEESAPAQPLPSQAAPNEPEAEQKREEPEQERERPQPAAEQPAPVSAEVSSSAQETETAAPVSVSQIPTEPPLAEQVSAQPTEGFQQAESSEQAESSAGGTDDMAKKEKEVAANTAAAWASWRRIRETGDAKAKPSPEPPRKETEEASVSQDRDQAAMAVAAGAEKAPAEVPTEAETETESESAEIASIVDSVLADLRPKIVKEISKKLGKRK
jgi:CheY-like chemotaxis protein